MHRAAQPSLETWLGNNGLDAWTLGLLCDDINTVDDAISLRSDSSRIDRIMKEHDLSPADRTRLLSSIDQYKTTNNAEEVTAVSDSNSTVSSGHSRSSSVSSNITTTSNGTAISTHDMTALSSSMFMNRFEIEVASNLTATIDGYRSARNSSRVKLRRYEDMHTTNRKQIRAFFHHFIQDMKELRDRLYQELDNSLDEHVQFEQKFTDRMTTHLHSLYQIQSEIGDTLSATQEEEQRREKLMEIQKKISRIRYSSVSQPLEQTKVPLSMKFFVDEKLRDRCVKRLAGLECEFYEDSSDADESADDGSDHEDDEKHISHGFSLNTLITMTNSRGSVDTFGKIGIDEDKDLTDSDFEEPERPTRRAPIGPIDMSRVSVVDSSSSVSESKRRRNSVTGRTQDSMKGEMTNVLLSNDTFWLSDPGQTTNQWLEFDCGSVVQIRIIRFRFSSDFNCHPWHFDVQCRTDTSSSSTGGLYVTAEKFETAPRIKKRKPRTRRQFSADDQSLRQIKPHHRSRHSLPNHRSLPVPFAIDELREDSFESDELREWQTFELSEMIVTRFVRLFFHDVHDGDRYPYCLVSQVIFE